MSDIDELLFAVEKLRDRLHAMIEYKELNDPEVLTVSQLLDQALNEYSAAVKQGSILIAGKDLKGRRRINY